MFTDEVVLSSVSPFLTDLNVVFFAAGIICMASDHRLELRILLHFNGNLVQLSLSHVIWSSLAHLDHDLLSHLEGSRLSL